jgi:hypothetical protein
VLLVLVLVVLLRVLVVLLLVLVLLLLELLLPLSPPLLHRLPIQTFYFYNSGSEKRREHSKFRPLQAIRRSLKGHTLKTSRKPYIYTDVSPYIYIRPAKQKSMDTYLNTASPTIT